jgi:predicted small lipoprotein YifL
MRKPTRHTLVVAAAALALVAIAACGSRGPLDVDGPLVVATEAGEASVGQEGGPSPGDGAADQVSPPKDAGKEGGSIIDCPVCLLQDCGQKIFACIQTPACAGTLQCVLQTCLTGGSLNPVCAFNCAQGDPAGALQVLQVFQCVTQTCGDDCGALLGLLTGGGGGKPPPPVDAGKKPDAAKLGPDPIEPDPAELSPEARRAIIRHAFSPWPELTSKL